MNRDRSQRLGRGLAALLGDASPAAVFAEVHEIATGLLDPNPHQPRGAIDPASLEELVASIKIHGIIQPLLVRRTGPSGERLQIVAGERRWRAATTAGLPAVPCLVQVWDDQQSAAAALVENLQRLDLNAMEEAQGFDRLVVQFHITQEALADVVGKSRSHVANTLRLLKLPQSVQSMVRTGQISAGHARTLLGHPDPVAAAQRIVARGLSVRQAEDLATRAAEPQSLLSETTADPDITSIERNLAEQLGLAVKLRARGGRGSLTLRFTHLDQLDFLLARLGNSGRPV